MEPTLETIVKSYGGFLGIAYAVKGLISLAYYEQFGKRLTKDEKREWLKMLLLPTPFEYLYGAAKDVPELVKYIKTKHKGSSHQE